MKLALTICSAAAGMLLLAGCEPTPTAVSGTSTPAPTGETFNANETMDAKINKTDADWKKELTPEQYEVLRQKGTERAFTGQYWNNHDAGTYRCAGCGQVLFESDTKYDSGCGWPSFYAPKGSNAVATASDRSHLMERTEVLCSKCGGHLGHVFDDGPNPTGLRYCINSASLDFEKKSSGGKTNSP